MTEKYFWMIIFLFLFAIYTLFMAYRNYNENMPAKMFFMANCEIPPWVYMLVSTIFLFSTLAFFIHPALIFKEGFSYSYVLLSVILVPLIGALFQKKQWILSKTYGSSTIGEILSIYFNSRLIIFFISFITLAFAIPFLALQFSLAGSLLNILTEGFISNTIGSIFLGAVVFGYVSLSGLRTITTVDTLFFVITFFGIICIGFIVYDLVGNWAIFSETISKVSLIKKSFVSVSSFMDFERIDLNNFNSSMMILSFVFALTGLQLSPNFSTFSFSSKSISAFAPQQTWICAAVLGFVLLFFTIMLGVGSNVLGANPLFNKSGFNISNVLPDNIGNGMEFVLIPNLINIISLAAPLFFGLMVFCALASLTSSGIILLTTGNIITKDIIKKILLKQINDKSQISYSRLVMLMIFIFSLIVSSLDIGIITLLSFSLSFSCQMIIPMAALCYFPNFTKESIFVGLIIGFITIVFTSALGQLWFEDYIAWGKWPLGVHSAMWGVIMNLITVSFLSYLTKVDKQEYHKNKLHKILQKYNNQNLEQRSLIPSGWVLVITWFFFGLGPGNLIGNQIFGNPNSLETWSFGIPSIWLWQMILWAFGGVMVWFLAYKLEFSVVPKRVISVQVEAYKTN